MAAVLLFTACGPAGGRAKQGLTDGIYEAEVESSASMFRVVHCELVVEDGKMTAVMAMSGEGYGYVYPGTAAEAEAADESEYIPFERDSEGRKTFAFPIEKLDTEYECAAYSIKKDTWYDRTLVFRLSSDGSEIGLTLKKRMKLDLATQFSVDYYEGGYKYIKLGDGSRFLVVPEGMEKPEGLDSSISVLQQPIENIYIAATSSMSLFDALGSLSSVSLSGTKEDGWYIENAKQAMHDGSIIYAGKYSEPDYELLLSKECPLAVESMMIGHAPDVREKLEELGMVVLVDQSSNESHPLAKTEWIKLYAALLNKEDEAERLFDEQMKYLSEVEKLEKTGKTAAFFYISSAGNAVVRNSDDYISKMIELAGGRYIFDDLEEGSGSATVTIEMEEFFSHAKDADYVFYNGAITGEVNSIEELVQKNPLLKEFKAVQNGNVWCTTRNLYQETTQLGEMIKSLRTVFTGEADNLTELPYLYRLMPAD